MQPTENVMKLSNLLHTCLLLDAPILTGNLIKHITQLSSGKIRISGPAYSQFWYKKTGKIITRYNARDKNGNIVKLKFVVSKSKNINPKLNRGLFDYAWLLNEVGAFGTHNKSQHWTNRSINNACDIFAMMLGNAEVVGRLPE